MPEVKASENPETKSLRNELHPSILISLSKQFPLCMSFSLSLEHPSTAWQPKESSLILTSKLRHHLF